MRSRTNAGEIVLDEVEARAWADETHADHKTTRYKVKDAALEISMDRDDDEPVKVLGPQGDRLGTISFRSEALDMGDAGAANA